MYEEGLVLGARVRSATLPQALPKARRLMKTSMRFDLVDLRLFLFVVEASSITHGAARAGMALASASERVRLMEESLGVPLLERASPRRPHHGRGRCCRAAAGADTGGAVGVRGRL